MESQAINDRQTSCSGRGPVRLRPKWTRRSRSCVPDGDGRPQGYSRACPTVGQGGSSAQGLAVRTPIRHWHRLGRRELDSMCRDLGPTGQNEEVSMETRIAKKSRFQIVTLEERVAPTMFAPPCASAQAYASAHASGRIPRLISQLVRILRSTVATPLRVRQDTQPRLPLVDRDAEGPEVPPHGTVEFQTIRGVARSTANPRGRAKRGHGVSGRRGCPFASYLACPNFAEGPSTQAAHSLRLYGSMGSSRFGTVTHANLKTRF